MSLSYSAGLEHPIPTHGGFKGALYTYSRCVL